MQCICNYTGTSRKIKEFVTKNLAYCFIMPALILLLAKIVCRSNSNGLESKITAVVQVSCSLKESHIVQVAVVPI